MFGRAHAVSVGRTCLVVIVVCLSAVVASAQAEDPIETARFRLGPLGLTPSGALTNLGVDTNVFNDAVDPKQDFTFTLSPRLDTWLRIRRVRVSLFGRSDLTYFHTYAQERSVDGTVGGRVELAGNRITPWVAGDSSSRRRQFGDEIDLRTRRTTTNFSLGADMSASARTKIGVSARRVDYGYDADSLFFGSNLRETLNRTEETFGTQVRYAWTPYTTVVLLGEAERDRFEFSPQRDADSVRVQAGLDINERALVGGRVLVGYRRFTGHNSTIPTYSGFVASFSTSMTLPGRTRLQFDGARDVTYSFERSYPYYISMGGIATVTPRLTTDWDVQFRAGGYRHAYRVVDDASARARIDRYTTFGAGVGYYLARDIRIGFNLDRQQRRVEDTGRRYTVHRIGTAVTYGR
jgi:hypothetical protein